MVKRERARVTEMIPERATGATSYRGFVSQGKEFAFSSAAISMVVLMVKNVKKRKQPWG